MTDDNSKNLRVAVLGASIKPERYSYQAVKMLGEHGHIPVPVNPRGSEVLGIAAKKSLDEIESPVDTLTVYVNPAASSAEYERIRNLNPRRVIFNPGAENSELELKLAEEGIEVVQACTLVMLRTGQF